MKSRNELTKQLNQTEQERGNLTVLFTNGITEQIGLSATEFECLDFIANNRPITAGQLARLTGLSTGGITGVVDRLEQAGFVQRRRDITDRRRVLLEVTFDKKTENRMRALYAPLAREFDKACREFTIAELKIILRYEQRSVAMVRKLLGHTSKND